MKLSTDLQLYYMLKCQLLVVKVTELCCLCFDKKKNRFRQKPHFISTTVFYFCLFPVFSGLGQNDIFVFCSDSVFFLFSSDNSSDILITYFCYTEKIAVPVFIPKSTSYRNSRQKYDFGFAIFIHYILRTYLKIPVPVLLTENKHSWYRKNMFFIENFVPIIFRYFLFRYPFLLLFQYL